jgi:uncharacterized protein YlaI
MKPKDNVVQISDRDARIQRLRNHNGHGFGCRGMHNGIGTLDCPHRLHHHHNVFCVMPTEEELFEADVTMEEFTMFTD